MEEIIFKILAGLPTAAAVLYIWIVSEKSHSKEREQWRQTIEQRDQRFLEIQKVTNQLIGEVKKLTYIIENYVINNGKATDRK